MDTTPEPREWPVYRLIDTRFRDAGAADDWMRETFGTCNVKEIPLHDIRRRLLEMPAHKKANRVSEALINRVRKVKQCMRNNVTPPLAGKE